MVRVIGEHPLATDENGAVTSKIATLFPASGVLITLPGVHATQRMAYLEMVRQSRLQAGKPPLAPDEEDAELESAVDLIVENSLILIRPDPDNMPLAFEADELLQTLVPKRQVRFLFLRTPKVRDAIKRRGECWRMNPLPRSPLEMKQMIARSRIAIGGRAIYYYNMARGTRLLSYQEFCGLAAMEDDELRRHLLEIQHFSAATNRMGRLEVGFFMADEHVARAAAAAAAAVATTNPTPAAPATVRFSSQDLAGRDFAAMGHDDLRAAYTQLRDRFCQAVPPEFRRDDPDDLEWRRAMFAALMAEGDEAAPEEALLGLGSEFFMQIEWLPGGRIQDGELILDPVLDETSDEAGTPAHANGNGNGNGAAPAIDEKARAFIFNFIREHGNLEYVNIGRVIQSLSRRPSASGRRDVYIAQLKRQDNSREVVRIIRMQKWGVREHLEEGKSLLDAMVESEEYTEYIMDRRLGCRQLGMRLPDWIIAKRIAERYAGSRGEYRGRQIWSPYFERDYIRGIATDKIAPWRLESREFAQRLARLLGRAAAPNIIVGRCDLEGHVIFDDGDEVVIEDVSGMPVEIIVADHTGTFSSYRRDLRDMAAEYAAAVNRRATRVPDPREFAEVFLSAFAGRFASIQHEYRKHRRAFDTLFKHRPFHEGGSFAFRWREVLARLDRTDVREVVEAIRAHLAAQCVSEPVAK